jgi:hypothetical protein
MSKQKKDAFYFTHDSNARNDVKILKLRKDLKGDGYAIYFMLIEVLREQKDHRLPLDSISDLEYDFRFPKDKILKVIKNYNLFLVEGDYFYSDRLLRSMEEYNEKKLLLSEYGKKGANARWGNNTHSANGQKKMVL